MVEVPYYSSFHLGLHCLPNCLSIGIQWNITWFQAIHLGLLTEDLYPAGIPIGPLSTHQRNAIWMAFRWRPDSGRILRAYWPWLTSTCSRELNLHNTLLLRNLPNWPNSQAFSENCYRSAHMFYFCSVCWSDKRASLNIKLFNL